MTLQIEDIFDVLSVVYPDHDFVVLMDQSSGHGKQLPNGLNASAMNTKFGGTQPKMRQIKVHEIGPFQSTLNVGDIQKMVFFRSKMLDHSI